MKHPIPLLLGCLLAGLPMAGAAAGSGFFVRLEGPPLSEVESDPAVRTLSPGLRRARLSLRAAAMGEAQSKLAAGLAGLGARIESRYRVLSHGAFVRLEGAQAAERLRKLPGVVAVVPERLHAPMLSTSTPWTGAPQVWDGVGLPSGVTGSGIRIGIIDSGIDYLHAGLGGSGDPADHASNDPAVLEPGTFPNAKVAGGWDFVGDDYDASGQFGSTTPRPDPDPLDPAANGHGTHVAGIAAGLGVLADGTPWEGPPAAWPGGDAFRVGPGVAPGARLYALKVFGRGGRTSSGVVVDALEWAADPDGDGSTQDRLDVVNLSLGTDFGEDDPSDPEVAAINRLSLLGCVVTVSAGNAGDTAFAVGTPGTARRAITVANGYDDGFDTSAIRIVAPEDLVGEVEAVEGAFAPRLGDIGPVTAQLVGVQPLQACEPLQDTARINGKIALIDRGVCFFVEKFRAAQAAGAVGVIVVNNVSGPPIPMGGQGDVSDIRIPGVMISREDGQRLRARLASGITVTLSDEVRIGHPEFAGSVNAGSARGPAHATGLLKPDLTAPGTSILSAGAGTGTGARVETGTSMSAPHVAGAAALVRQARPDWPVVDIKAVLMNTARPMVDTGGAAYRLSRSGAGDLDVAAAVRSPVAARANATDGTVSLSFGLHELGDSRELAESIRVVNRGTTPVTLDVASESILNQPGALLVPDVSSLTVPAGSEAVVGLTLRLEPGLWESQPDPTSDAEIRGRPRFFLEEAGGRVWFRGGPVPLQVPWQVAVRPAGTQVAGAPRVGAPAGDPVRVPVGVRGPTPIGSPLVGVFQLGATHANRGFQDERAAADVVAFGAASDTATAGGVSAARVYFGVAMAGAWATPLRAFLEVDLEVDTTLDGIADRVILNGNTGSLDASDPSLRSGSTDAFVPLVQDRLAAGLVDGGAWNGVSPLLGDPAPFQNGVMVLTAPASDLGLSAARSRLRYRVVTRGAFAESTPWADFDVAAPVVDPAPYGLGSSPWQPAGRQVAVRLHRARAASAGFGGAVGAPVLLLHLHNQPGRQAEVVRIDLTTGDFDRDGLPDDWEIASLGDLEGGGSGDRDADGAGDRDEWLAGTDPLDPADNLRLLVPEPARGRLQWTSRPGRTYTLWRSGRFDSGFEPVVSGITGNAGVIDFTDPDLASGPGPFFYRVTVEGGP